MVLIYQLVRIATLNESGTLDEISAGEVNHFPAETMTALESFDSITRTAFSIGKAAEKIYGEAKELQTLMTFNFAAAQTALVPHIEAASLIEGQSYVKDETLHFLSNGGSNYRKL